MLKILMRLAFAALFLSATSLAYRYFQPSSDPLAKGVPPRTNADGTVDYTMLSKQFSNSDNPGQIQEWVVRLDPKYVSGAYGNEDMSVSGGGVSFESKGQPNLGYFAWFRIADLQPVNSFAFGRNFSPPEEPSFYVVLKAEKDRPGIASDIATKTLKLHYKLTTAEEYGLEVYTGFVKPYEGETQYVLWSDTSHAQMRASLKCFQSVPTCGLTFFLSDGRRITGQLAIRDRASLPSLAPRFEKFMQEHTQVDRTYPGTPFVYGGTND